MHKGVLAESRASCWCALVVMGLWLSCSCVATPRASSELRKRTEPIEFSGLFEVPAVELAVQAKNHKTQRWVTFANAVTRQADPVLGQTGSPYFRYSVRATVPQDPAYWIAHRESRRMEAQVRVVHGERVLSVFDADAEGCARRAHARGTSEREALAQCASPQEGVARVFVASCGGLGEVCCPLPSGAESCEPGFGCSASGLCEKPNYPLPAVRDFQVDLPLAPGYVLQDAWLVMDDRADGTRTTRPLVSHYATRAGVVRELPHPNVARLRFDLGFWTPGSNRVWVSGVSVNGERRRTVASAPMALDYDIPRQLGLALPGRFRLPSEHFPRLLRDCHGPSCKDADADGLSDLWENIALRQLRPRLQLDGHDGLFKADKTDTVRVLSSVLPIERDGQSYVLFAHVIAFSRDYGHLGLFRHPGDTEGFGMLFRVDADGGLTWVSSAAKGHACLTCGPRYSFREQEFAQDGVPMLYVERDKHGLWQNGKSCREMAAFSCGGQRTLRPAPINVGDPSHDGSRGLIDGLDGLAPNGPFAHLAGVFPGEAVWTRSRARVPGHFCGGRTRCNERFSANQPGNVIADLLSLFQRELSDGELQRAQGSAASARD